MLNPLLLWFLPLALVPIVLHLITLYRLRTVELPTFRFLMDSYIQQRRKIKLLEFLLMLLRTAFVALIILALSRPVLSRFGWLSGQTGRDVWIVFDSGVSMGLRSGGTTSLERAQIAGRAVVGQLAPDDHVNILRAGEKPDLLIDRFAGEPQPIIDEINSIQVGSSPANIAAALEEVFNSPQRATKIVYVLTDANRLAWSGLAGNPVLAAAAHDSQLAVINVGPDEPIVNLAAIGDAPRATHAIVGLPVLLSATVVNGSPEKPKDTVLTVVLDDQQVMQIPLSLRPGQKVTKAVVVKPTHAGVVRGRFELPADAFPDDDTFLFSLNVEPKLNVFIVTPPPQPGHAADSSDAADFFIRAALASPLAAETGPLADTRAIAASLGVTSVLYTGLTDTMLAAADTVILSDVPLDPALAARLRKFVSDGGGLIIFPGASTQQDNYNAFLLNPPTVRKTPNEPFPGLALLPPIGNPDDEAAFQPVTNIDLTHPILSAFTQEGTNFFSTIRIYRYFPIQLPPTKPVADAMPGEVVEKPRVLLRLPDRTPALVECKIDEGRVLMAGFPATPDWSNLPLKPEFVPILLRAVAHVRRAVPAEAPTAVKPQEPAPIYLTDRWPDAKVEVVDPAGKPTAISLHRSGRQMVGVAAQTDRKGYYTFRILPRLAGAPDQLDLGFAVNLDITDADFTMMAESQVKDVLKPMPVTYLRSSANDPVLAQQLTRKREIWRTLIWITFAIIGVEFLLATLRPSGTRKLAGKSDVAPRGRLARLADRLSGEPVRAGTGESK